MANDNQKNDKTSTTIVPRTEVAVQTPIIDVKDINGKDVNGKDVNGKDVNGKETLPKSVPLIENVSVETPHQVNFFDNKQKPVYNKSKYTKDSKSKITVGSLLEYRIKRLIFAMGYFTKVGILVKTAQDELADTITDLDVLGIYVHKDFTSKTIWADCKSGETARPLERISWIKGLMNTVHVNDVIFVKGGVRNSTKQYARKSGIQILDLKIIEKLEKDYEIKNNDWRGSWNPDTQYNKLVILQKIDIPSREIYKKIASFISCDYWTFDNFTRIKKTITALRQLSQISELSINKEQLSAIKWAIFELVNLFVLASLNICKELYYFSEEEKRDTILEGLISSEISIKKREELIEAVFKTAYSLVMKQFPDFRPPEQNPKFNIVPPAYFEAYVDLLLRITNNPVGYYDILRLLDFILMEYDLQQKKIDESAIAKIFNNYNDIITGAKTILHFLCQVTGINRANFQLIN